MEEYHKKAKVITHLLPNALVCVLKGGIRLGFKHIE